jgi:hypothetical protein
VGLYSEEIRRALNENYILKPEGYSQEDCIVKGIEAIIFRAIEAERRRIATLLNKRGQPWIDLNIAYSSPLEVEKAIREVKEV